MNTVTITFSQDDLNSLGALLDVAVKASGLQVARPALNILAKLEEAVAAVNTPKTEETEEGHA